MKKSGLLILASLLLVTGIFAQHTIVVTNSTDMDRKGEMVEVSLSALKVSFQTKSYVLKNKQNKEVAYQLVFNGNKKPETLIFQADVKGKSTSIYSLTVGKPSVVKPKTFARFVPERKDDFAWENEIAAYRMYGPALANENPSNGVDFWAKSTDKLVVDQRYKDDIYNEISYHIDHGQGLDFYKVGHTLGCGGIAPYANGKLWVGDHFSSYKVIEVGSLRTIFKLGYDSVKVGNTIYKEELTITVTAGSMMNKGIVKLTGPAQNMELAAGIYLHDEKGALKQNIANGTTAYAEDAFSDAKVPSGRNYVGIYIPVKANKAFKEGEHALVTGAYKVGDSFTYYFGGGWSKWLYPTDNDWFKALAEFSAATKNPLKVSVK
ncbi:MAG: DUF4861 family protein [Paludibacter sp.]|nr:DUF4861 family protein [Paludibacter sp.]